MNRRQIIAAKMVCLEWLMREMNVLLVDDEREFLDLLSKRLAKRNVRVKAVQSGDEAIRAIMAEPFDVVVLDMKMPGKDGLETLQAIKSLPCDCQVVMLTGHASVEAAVQGMELGAFDYLMKPVAISELIFKLEDACRVRVNSDAGSGRVGTDEAKD